MKKGVITDINAAVRTIKKAVEICEQKSGMKITQAYVGIAGEHIHSINTDGVVAVKGEHIAESDIERVIESAKAHKTGDKEILHILSQEYIVDEQDGVKDPVGMSGKRLKAKVHIIFGSATATTNLYQSCTNAGLDVTRVVVEPIASAASVLSKDERELGVVLLDIGGGTTDIVIYKNNSVIHTAVVPIGGNHITGDISIGLRTPRDEAANIKHTEGIALTRLIGAGETIRVTGIQNRPDRICERKMLGNIIEARMRELFELSYKEIIKHGYQSIIGAGVVLTGGSSLLKNADMLADEVFKMQSRIGTPNEISGLKELVASPIYATAVGLVKYGLDEYESSVELNTENRQRPEVQMQIHPVDNNANEALQETLKPRLCVIGVGGAGGNVVNRMINDGVGDVDYIAMNTDAADLRKSKAKSIVVLGKEITKGLGAGMKPEIGKNSAMEAEKEIKKHLEGVDMLFIAAGMGGGTGTGAAPVIAQWAMERNILTVAVVTTPFAFEGKKRMAIATEGIEELKKHIDTIMIIPNEKLFQLEQNKHRQLKLTEAFQVADDVLKNAISGLTNMINKVGDINVDFADVCTVMKRQGKAIISVGSANGEERGRKAAEQAISSPLIKDDQIGKATGVIINIIADPDLTLNQAQEASSVIEGAAENANVIWGVSHDSDLKDTVHVTIIATGFENYHYEIDRTKTLSIQNSTKVFEGHENTKISELNRNTPMPHSLNNTKAPEFQQDTKPQSVYQPHQSENELRPQPQPAPYSGGHKHVSNAIRVSEQDMQMIEDKPYVPDHYQQPDKSNYDIPAFIRRREQQ
ncbi:hypothetical protein CHS0354_035364 [Potamilus streckersoni]|uniref:Cell division protein FtsZ n=1 Tax=Potamilus streckersoni TaxID=2493646 RepID=A0AAE0S325_9BIVA|nr:hypothetical protein CHS0354_035364 [Potamilus streckersoni]